MWTGEIVSLEEPSTENPTCWIVRIQTNDGRNFTDCTTEALWNTLVLGEQYTLTNPQED